MLQKEDFNKRIGNFIRQKRIERNWTQADLAEKLGNNFQNISRLERGEISPTLYWCYLLSEAFETNLPDLLKEFDSLND